MIRKPGPTFRVPRPLLALLMVALLLSQYRPSTAMAGEPSPLEPIDTSSPQGTLHGFVAFMDEAQRVGFGAVQDYLASTRLYLSPDDLSAIRTGFHRLKAAERAIDFSALPPAMARESSRRLTIQLKDVLDRIALPPLAAVPDAKGMAAEEFKRWTIPGTEVRIARVESGSRAGEYLFTAETVSRLPEFYEQVRHLPAKPGALVGLYEFAVNSPAGVALVLQTIVPPRWLLQPPGWARVTVLEQPLWRWLGIVAVLAVGLGLAVASHRLARRWRRSKRPVGRWGGLLLPVTLLLVAPAAAVILAEVLRISGAVYHVATLSLWALFFLALTWNVWATGTVIAESVIRSERLRTSSIDSQLIRLVLRLITIVGALAVLVVGADRVGLPAYSVVAGLGVGGLAVALAGQQTLANLLGSLIVMMEKPFRIGDWIKVNDLEGTVERVGFRSTRLRTFHDSLVTIPSSALVNSTIDNMELRKHREVKTLLNLTYDTPLTKIEGFVAGIKRILEAHPGTRKDNLQVAFYDFGPHSLDIWVKFLVKVPNRLTELAERQAILLQILQLAEAQGVRFAFPTRTVYVESVLDQGRSDVST